MDHMLGEDFIFNTLKSFIIDSVMEQNPKAELNTERLETIKADCEIIAAASEELELNGFSVDVINEHRDVVIECFFDELILTPTSGLLTVFRHASDVQFQAGKDMEEEKDQLVVTLTYEKLFSR